MEELVLDGLLVVTVVLSAVLILISAGSLGRKMADLEYQIAANIDGVRRIQSWINVRTHSNRILLGLVFGFVTVLLLADAPMGWRTWSFRILYVVLLLSFSGSAILDWLGERRQLRLLMVDPPEPSVDVATIQPAAVSDIVDAVREDRQP